MILDGIEFARTHLGVSLLVVLIGALICLSNLRFKDDGTVGVPVLCFLAVYLLGSFVPFQAGAQVGFKTVEVGRSRDGIETESIPTREVSGSERWHRAERYSGVELFGFIGVGLVHLWLLVPKVHEGMARRQAKMAKSDSSGGGSELTEFDVFKIQAAGLCVLLWIFLYQALQKP